MTRLLTFPNIVLGIVATSMAALGTYASLSLSAHMSDAGRSVASAPACIGSTDSQNEVYFVSCGGFF